MNVHNETSEETATARTLVSTPHPLQRVGAFTMAALAERDTPESVTPDDFDAAVERMARDAVRTAPVASTSDEDAFWYKTSFSFFPNSPMNHPSRSKLSVAAREKWIRGWRDMPDPDTWPGEPCALCGRPACAFYGKRDIPLEPGTTQRNTTPSGHEGTALCWACLCSFHALPYGCTLTGGQSSALHSRDDRFVRRVTADRVAGNRQHITLGKPVQKTGLSTELSALRQLRHHDEQLTRGVDLLVFSNDNREPFLAVHSLEQPLAEWLRRTIRTGRSRRGFAVLVQAHGSGERSGAHRLARYAFHQPRRILATATAFLVNQAGGRGLLTGTAAELVMLCFSYATEVMEMNTKDIDRIRALATNVAAVLAEDRETGPLKKYQVAHRKPADLKHWFKRSSIAWLLRPPAGDGTAGADGATPLITDEQWRLLFDPDGQGREYRDLLFIAVLERLHELGWRPDDPETAAELAADDDEGKLFPEQEDSEQ